MELVLWESMGVYLIQTFHPAQPVQVGSTQLCRLQPHWHHACLVRRTHTHRKEATTYGIVHATKASSYLTHTPVQSVKAANIQPVLVHHARHARQARRRLRAAQRLMTVNAQQARADLVEDRAQHVRPASTQRV